MFQRRINGSVSFQRNWQAYKTGFGNLNGNFWLGLDNVHEVTKIPSTLRVDLKNWDGSVGYARYSSFNIDDEKNKYKLHVSGYTGNIHDDFGDVNTNGMYFTTTDWDNDQNIFGNCANLHGGAWWYKNCAWSNLNGIFPKGGIVSNWKYMLWYHWKNKQGDIKFSEMKTRPNY